MLNTAELREGKNVVWERGLGRGLWGQPSLVTPKGEKAEEASDSSHLNEGRCGGNETVLERDVVVGISEQEDALPSFNDGRNAIKETTVAGVREGRISGWDVSSPPVHEDKAADDVALLKRDAREAASKEFSRIPLVHAGKRIRNETFPETVKGSEEGSQSMWGSRKKSRLDDTKFRPNGDFLGKEAEADAEIEVCVEEGLSKFVALPGGWVAIRCEIYVMMLEYVHVLYCVYVDLLDGAQPKKEVALPGGWVAIMCDMLQICRSVHACMLSTSIFVPW